MAKIKFNLNFGGEQIRTLDDLRDNFSIEDVLDVYNNGLLVKWLDVHNHKDELEKVNAIHATNARGILSELIRIFGVTSDPSEIEESLSVLDYLEERKKFWADIKAGKFDEIARNITKSQNEEETHHASKKTYDELVQEIIDNHLDLHHIYDCLDVITADYPDILREKHSELFETLHTKRPLTLYALFAHHGTRPYFTLNDDEIKADYSEERAKFYYLPKSPYVYVKTVAGHEGCLCWPWRVKIENYTYATDASDILLSVQKKLHFINMLNSISFTTFVAYPNKDHTHFIELNHPYLKKYNGIEYHKYDSSIDDIWHVIEPEDKRFMVFYSYWSYLPPIGHQFGQQGLVASTHRHHLARELHLGLELLYPIFEGLDVKTQKVDSNSPNFRCAPFWYMEAR